LIEYKTRYRIFPHIQEDSVAGGSSFGTVAVSGQSDVVADASNDTLTIVAGTNITITTNAGTDSLTINASGGGSSVSVVVDFGASFTHFAQTVVTGQTWVAAGSDITVTPLAAAGAAEETALMAFSTAVSDIVAGTGFTLSVYTPVEAKGTYTFSCIGV
jgi:hypothetical protein